MMHVGIRESIYRALDYVMFWTAIRKYGLFGPLVSYQPLPWCGLEEGRRARGSRRRLEAIRTFLESKSYKPTVILDVGANIGFFSLAFAESGAIAYALEGDDLNLRLAVFADRHVSKRPGGAFVPIRMWCDPDNVDRLPTSDVTLCLSVWHHWVRHFGLEGATAMLDSLVSRTSAVLFFDTGESEMPAGYNLPFRDGESGEWLRDYLSRFPNVSSVTCVGLFEAFAPNSNETAGGVRRHLFAVEKR